MMNLGDQLAYVNGELCLDGHSVEALAAEFGTPLHVLSETQLRTNYRSFVTAFASRWPQGVAVSYSVKANAVLAIRQVFSDEGAGSDCLGINELQLSLMGDTPGGRIILNGSNKTFETVRAAVEVGARVNIDDESEWDLVLQAARSTGRCARVGLRVKPILARFEGVVSELRPMDIGEYARSNKWGVSLSMAERLVRLADATPNVHLEGVHYHLGRQVGSPRLFELLVPEVVQYVTDLRAATGWNPGNMNLGGGFTQGRDPFSRRLRDPDAWPRPDDRPGPTIDEYAETIVAVMRQELEAQDLPLPDLEFESGRFLVANAGISITRVGSIKRIGDDAWVNVDLPGSHVGLTRAPQNAHAVVAANRHGDSGAVVEDTSPGRWQIVGPLCTADVICAAPPGRLPAVGECLAVLDTGAYADSEAPSSNLMPRPAVVMVGGGEPKLVRRRETFDDLMQRECVPPKFAPV